MGVKALAMPANLIILRTRVTEGQNQLLRVVL